MKRLLGIVILIIAWGGFIFADPALALDVEVGQQVQLKATNPQGVPLHENPFPSLKGRLPDGVTATVTATDREKHWIKVQIVILLPLSRERIPLILIRFCTRQTKNPTI